MSLHPKLPDTIVEGVRKARRLEWMSLGFLVSIVVVMYLVTGSSQAMKAAWLEDMLSLIPPSLFLISTSIERREPTARFPFGFHRVASLAFFASALALTAMGGYLLIESSLSLFRREHPTIGSLNLFGHQVWLGWLMIAALVYSVIPPVILGRLKRPIARDIRDKILYTDADMNAADWKTGVAGVAGIIGIAYGFWWADSAAAALISLSVLKDGISNLTTAVAELMDGAPREVDSSKVSGTAETIASRLRERYPGHSIQMRETGRYIRALVTPERHESVLSTVEAESLAGDDAQWLIEASISISEHSGRDPDQRDEPRD